MLKQPFLNPIPPENKYELFRDYEITVNGVDIVVPKFFRYDGASIPSPAWQLTYSPFHPDVMLPSLVHDWMFYNHQENRDVTDEIFYRLLRDNGVNYLKANTMWAAVRTGGALFWDNDQEDIDTLVRLCKKVRDKPNYARYRFPNEVIQQCHS